MVKLNLKRRKNQEEEILEDVDLTAIVEQRRKRSQESKVEEAERGGEKTSPSKTEVEGNEKRDLEPNVAAATTFNIDSYLQKRLFMWLIEQAINNENEYNMLMNAIDEMSIDKLRILCRVLLKRLKERS